MYGTPPSSQVFNMRRKYRRKKLETYLVNITVFEGRHYALQNMSSYVKLKVGKQKAITRTRHGTDAPYYSQFFSFQFNTNLETLFDVTIFLKVVKPRSLCKKSKVLGYCALDVGTVYEQPDHQFFRKWAILTSYKGRISGVRGYLKVTISVTAKDEVPKIPLVNPLSLNDIEGNLLLPQGAMLERHRAFFIFRVYRGYDIIKRNQKTADFEEIDADETHLSHRNRIQLPKVYVKITLAGGKTSRSKRTSFPIFNQSITISELYPTLIQRIKLQLIYQHYGRTKVAIEKYLRLSSISSVSCEGFLPTFGPSYIHFYKKSQQGEEYVGKILLSLETKLLGETAGKIRIAKVEDIPPIFEGAIWKSENVLLFLSILDVSIIDKRYSHQPISFEMNWGRMKLLQNYDESIIVPNICTEKYRPETSNKKFWYLDFKDRVPCLSIVEVYPYTRRRLYASNLMDDLVTKMESRLKDIESYFTQEEFVSFSHEIEDKLVDFFDYVGDACQRFIDIQKGKGNVSASDKTELDTLKSGYVIHELEDVKSIAAKGYNPRMKKNSFRKGERLTKRLRILIDHPQECWPNVYLWLKSGSEKAECLKLEPRHLVHSVVPEEQGKLCGKVNDLYFLTNRLSTSLSPVVCKVELFTWLGMESQKEDCYKNIPKGYMFPEFMEKKRRRKDIEIPKYLVRSHSLVFTCRAHIYQGRFVLAFDYSGLADFFARVIVHDQAQQTMVRPQTLSPIWDESLHFHDVIIYGSKEHIKAHPPSIVLEVNDKDKCGQIDYVGFALVTPKIKFAQEKYVAPKLKWHRIKNDRNDIGDVLAAIELLERSDKDTDDFIDQQIEINQIRSIPLEIRPKLIKYRIEVNFWGVRNLKKLKQFDIKRPKIVIECNENTIQSEVAQITRLNFPEPIKKMDLDLPDFDEFLPPLAIKLFDLRSFGRFVYAGTHLTFTKQFFYHPITRSDWEMRISRRRKSFESMLSQPSLTIKEPTKKAKETKSERFKLWLWNCRLRFSKENVRARIKAVCRFIWCCGFCKLLKRLRKKKMSKKHKKEHEKFLKAQKYMVQDTRIPIEIENEEVIDWWSKYFNSLEDPYESALNSYNKNFRIKVYLDELENQPEFERFQDALCKFKLFRGKTTGDDLVDEKVRIATLKCKIRIYPWDETEKFYRLVNPRGLSLKGGFFQDSFPNDELSFTVRVYCVRALKLRPTSLSAACNSFIAIKMGAICINDKKNYVHKNNNPFFGKCFELVGTFPKDHQIIISINDLRMTGSELVGQTVIDIENRYYTRHRANCGLQYEFKLSGLTPWRDQVDPSVILSELCLRNNLEAPQYGHNYVYVAGHKFSSDKDAHEDEDQNEIDDIIKKENLALQVLHNWHTIPVVGCHLVPDHIETRSLYNRKSPGIEQGKVQLWVDLFPTNDLPVPHKVNIKTRKPISYELRVTIWNTEAVVLNEDDFFGGRKSDIYVKGWVTNPMEAQSTDVHYRSLTGEGNFNWRFVFVFDYLLAENMIVLRQKQTIFDKDITERKAPCRLTLQVWDNDVFSKDDFLGSLTLYLTKFPRGARYSRQCTLRIMESAPRINLFKLKRMRGWWPFRVRGKTNLPNKHSLAGKVEAEFELITSDQAALCPVGMGREPPNPLPPPKRPDTSFNWLLNPFKTFKHIIWKNMKWKLLKIFFIVLIVLFIGLFLYTMPGNFSRRIIDSVPSWDQIKTKFTFSNITSKFKSYF